MTDEPVRCRYCGAEFADESDRDFHWYCEHLAELDDEQFRAASDEYNDRVLGSIEVDVPVAIPRETWEDVCERQGVNPESTSPDDIEDSLIDLIHPEFDYEIEPRVVTKCPVCSHKFTENEARSTTFDGTYARWQCPSCGEWSRGPPLGGNQ
jgi:rubrerythrin